MPNTITTNISDLEYTFLQQEAKRRKITKKKVIEEALNFYRKKQMEKLVQDGLKSRYSEYKDLNAEYLEAQNLSIKE